MVLSMTHDVTRATALLPDPAGRDEPASSSDLDDDSRLAQVGEGRFDGELTGRWNAIGGNPNGGYVLSLCARALRHTLSFPDPLAVSAFFLRRAVPGPVEVHTEIARRGGRTATGEARLIQNGEEILRTVATFTDLGSARGHTVLLGERPDLPDPERCVELSPGPGMSAVTIADRFEYRHAALPGWRTGRPTGKPETTFWLRFRDGRTADALSLPMLVDAAAPVVLELGEVGSSTVELTVHVRARPAAGWLACRVVTRHVIGGYHEEDFEVWDSEGKLVAQARQLALLPSRNSNPT